MKNFSEHTGKHRKGEHIANIILNIIFLWVLSMVPGWDLEFLKSGYMVVLTVMQINCVVQIAAAIVLLATEIRLIRNLVKIIAEAAGLVVVMMMYYIYPFDFSNFHNLGWLDKVLPIFFIIGMVVSVIKIISYILKTFFRSRENTTL